ncbi:MAG: hypothetical protein JO112_10105, partial [Planctomycetes bacterium]|nr:hypothetical protein [Planctomycetota bacterium]
MYPLNIYLIGCGADLLPQVRGQLAEQPAPITAEFANVNGVIEHLRQESEWTGSGFKNSRKGLFLFHLKSGRDLWDLKSLSGTFVGQPIL